MSGVPVDPDPDERRFTPITSFGGKVNPRPSPGEPSHQTRPPLESSKGRTPLGEMEGSTPPSGGRLTTPEIKACVWLLYQTPSHAAGGCLHAVLDDGNLYDRHIVWAISHARNAKCAMCEALGGMLLQLTKTQRHEVVNRFNPRAFTPARMWDQMRKWGYRLPKQIPTDGGPLYLEAYLRQALAHGPHVSIPSPPRPTPPESPPPPPSQLASSDATGLFQLPKNGKGLVTQARDLWAQLNQPPFDLD